MHRLGEGSYLEKIIVEMWRERESSPTGLEVRRPTFEFWLRLLLELCDRGQIKVAVLTLEGRCEGERKGARENAGKQYELPNC